MKNVKIFNLLQRKFLAQSATQLKLFN